MAEVPAGVVTVTSAGPGAPALGLVTVSAVSLLTAKFEAAAVPKRTPVVSVNPVPVTVTVSPPATCGARKLGLVL